MATIIISLSVITAPRFIDRSRETFEYRTSPPRIIPDFSSRDYYTRRSHYRNHGTRMLSIRTPCMTVADVGQRGNRSWGSVRVVDSWPSKRRSTLLCSYHAISCCPLESGPRASFLASFTVCKLYLHLCRSLSLCSSLVFELWNTYETTSVRVYAFIPRILDADRNCSIKLKLEEREITDDSRIYRHPVCRHGRRGTLDSPPQFRRATEITAGTRCFRVLRWDPLGWDGSLILNDREKIVAR